MTERLEHQLRDIVRYALQAHGYQHLRTRDCEVRDAYFTSVADAIIRQIKLSWTFEAPDILRKNLANQPPQMPAFDPSRTWPAAAPPSATTSIATYACLGPRQSHLVKTEPECALITNNMQNYCIH
jgi:hypothetical protein